MDYISGLLNQIKVSTPSPQTTICNSDNCKIDCINQKFKDGSCISVLGNNTNLTNNTNSICNCKY